eukprot:scaffold492_cov257-Pinguiococcus_pyrenoidosus.AAC.50
MSVEGQLGTEKRRARDAPTSRVHAAPKDEKDRDPSVCKQMPQPMMLFRRAKISSGTAISVVCDASMYTREMVADVARPATAVARSAMPSSSSASFPPSSSTSAAAPSARGGPLRTRAATPSTATSWERRAAGAKARKRRSSAAPVSRVPRIATAIT